MRNLVDLHSHILPGLDDGPTDLSGSLKMLKELEMLGFYHVFATPHHRLYSWAGIGAETVENYVKHLAVAAEKRGISVKVLPGMEFDFDENILARTSSAPGGARHFLVDVGFWGVPMDLGKIFQKMMEKGANVFLVHPERNKELCVHKQELSDLINSGVRLVGNIGSFSGMYGRKVKRDAKDLLKDGYYWALASDMHSHDQSRWIRDGIETLVSLVGKTDAEDLMSNRPMQIVMAMEGVR